jgi:hypothetical protein
MKRISTVICIPFLAATVATLGPAQSSSAQDLVSRQASRQVIAQQDPSITPSPAPENSPSSITPSTSTSGLPTNYGLVRSVSNGMLDIRTLDGNSKQIPIPSNLTSAASTLQQGSLVGFDTDATGNLTRLEPPAVDRKLEGTISAVEEDQITVQSASGETMTTSVDSATIARLGLAPGKEVSVTTYQGTWANLICCVEKPPIPVTPIPSGGGTVEPPTPTRALW